MRAFIFFYTQELRMCCHFSRRQAEQIDYSWEEEEEEEDDEEHPEDSIDEDWSPSLGPGASPLIKAWGQTKKSRSFVSVAGLSKEEQISELRKALKKNPGKKVAPLQSPNQIQSRAS